MLIYMEYLSKTNTLRASFFLNFLANNIAYQSYIFRLFWQTNRYNTCTLKQTKNH